MMFPRTRLHHLIEEQARSEPGATALTYKRDSVTYGELWARVERCAAGLRDAGVGRSDRVGVFLEKRIETVVAMFGASLAGAVFVPINPLLRGRQVAYILADCGVKVLATSSERADQLAGELDGCPVLERLVLVDGEHHPSRPVTPWEALLDGGTVPPAGVGVDVDLAAILYTSGSTGSPKGVMLSHRNMIVGAESVSSYLHNVADDVILAVLPLSFDAGLSQVTTAFAVGAHVILHNHALPADVVRLCARHGVTGLTCVPPLWIQLAARAWPEDATRRLRYFANTGGRMPRQTLDELRAHFPQASPYLMYGLTEAFRSTFLDPAQVDAHPDSIGRAIPNAEILVVRDDGSPCDPGEEGELVHRGPLVAMGYWNDPERTAERFRPVPQPVLAGAHSTEIAVWSGDRVVADANGYLYFVGRHDDMIKTSGYRVSPSEIEEVAFSTALVGDAVALGVDDADLGQRIVLVASPRRGTGDRSGDADDELLATLRRHLPMYMVPSEIVWRDELPRSPNGKFDRHRIREGLDR